MCVSVLIQQHGLHGFPLLRNFAFRHITSEEPRQCDDEDGWCCVILSRPSEGRFFTDMMAVGFRKGEPQKIQVLKSDDEGTSGRGCRRDLSRSRE
ncbi:hypothetical protein RB195_017711 [Necator americanus]|uniref:Uncharacterized protein n=1 Tax=Necator americanus TaxID=51031 RepID=A0ABR1C9K8_NECAM